MLEKSLFAGSYEAMERIMVERLDPGGTAYGGKNPDGTAPGGTAYGGTAYGGTDPDGKAADGSQLLYGSHCSERTYLDSLFS